MSFSVNSRLNHILNKAAIIDASSCLNFHGPATSTSGTTHGTTRDMWYWYWWAP
jgi:hypothetical protein